MITLKDLTEKVKKRISDYIGFNVQEIFDQSDYITIYGGAVRDSIAGMDIHDVDILCMSQSAEKLYKFLNKKYNYKRLDLYDLDALNMYKGIRIISEPWTLMNDDKKIIQLIKPYYRKGLETETLYIKAYTDLIKNVDISCCGVFLEDGIDGILLKEACKYAIIHCLSKSFELQKWSKLFNDERTSFREDKLIKRGWTNLNKLPNLFEIDTSIYQKRDRKLKLLELDFKTDYDFKIWTEDEYIGREKCKREKPFPSWK